MSCPLRGRQKDLSSWTIFVALVLCKPHRHKKLTGSTEDIQKKSSGCFLNALNAFNSGRVSRELYFCNTTLSSMKLSLLDEVVSDDCEDLV